ncbi:MAG: VWA-like domain-containing protein [Actinomycetota bacterium]|nr:VWA-like domain-containing protein [Actinomycetota bacterium]
MALVNELSINAKIALARAKAVDLMPYLATGLFRLFPVESDQTDTMAVSSDWILHYNLNFVEETPLVELAGVLIHELHHLLQGHQERMVAFGAVDSFLWNIAADATINDRLLENGIKLPQTPITSNLLNINGSLTAEEIYLKINGQRDDLLSSFGEVDCGSCAGGSPRSYEVKHDGAPQTDSEALCLDLLARAIIKSDNAPAHLRAWANERVNPKINWVSLLMRQVRQALDPAANKDYAIGGWSRRESATFILPSLIPRHQPKVAIVVDTSGSMDTDAFQRIITEIASLIRTLHGAPMTVISCDDSVRLTQTIRDASAIELVGGGSTDLRVGIEKAAQIKPAPDVIVVMTDGLSLWPKQNPSRKSKVVIVLTSDEIETPNWATSIRITQS